MVATNRAKCFASSQRCRVGGVEKGITVPEVHYVCRCEYATVGRLLSSNIEKLIRGFCSQTKKQIEIKTIYIA